LEDAAMNSDQASIFMCHLYVYETKLYFYVSWSMKNIVGGTILYLYKLFGGAQNNVQGLL
jgi:hypothetical protein